MFQLRRILKYLVNGGIATATQFLTLSFAVEKMHADPLLASVVAFAVSLCTGFSLHRFVTFERRDRAGVGTQFFLVAGMALSNLVINTGAMYILLRIGVHYLVAQFFVTGAIAAWTYLGYNLIFKRNHSKV
jgi:putative flippase GtrA